MRIRICGRCWDLRYVPRSALLGKKKYRPGKGVLGDTDAPTVRGKTIRIGTRQPPREELDTLLHEMLHAADWNAAEEWVWQAAHDIARTLIRLGWRPPESEERPR